MHVQVNLLFGIAGIVYHIIPKATKNMFARLHLWAANIGLPLMMVAVTFTIINGSEVASIITVIGGTVVVFSVIMFAINVWKNIHPAP